MGFIAFLLRMLIFVAICFAAGLSRANYKIESKNLLNSIEVQLNDFDERFSVLVESLKKAPKDIAMGETEIQKTCEYINDDFEIASNFATSMSAMNSIVYSSLSEENLENSVNTKDFFWSFFFEFQYKMSSFDQKVTESFYSFCADDGEVSAGYGMWLFENLDQGNTDQLSYAIQSIQADMKSIKELVTFAKQNESNKTLVTIDPLATMNMTQDFFDERLAPYLTYIGEQL